MASAYRKEQHWGFGDGIYRIVSHVDPKFPEGAAWDLLNMVYHQESDNPETIRGDTQLGVTAMGGAVSGLFDCNNGDKLVAAATDGKIYEYGTDWAASSGARATGNSSAAGTRWSGSMFYGATTAKNLLVLANGIDAPVRYDTVNGAVSLGGTPPSTGNFPVEHRGRLWMAIGSTVYYSATNDCEVWTTAGGGGTVLVARGYDGDITGMASFGGSLFFFKRSSIYRFPPTATISELNIRLVSKAIGCVSHRTIAECIVGNTNILTFVSERGVEALQPSNSATGFDPVDLSRAVKPIIDRKNEAGMATAWGDFNVDRMEYYFSYPTSAATTPTEMLIANTARPRKSPRWTRSDYKGLTAGVTFNQSNTNYIQYVGDTGGKVYQLHVNTAHTRHGSSFTGRFRSRAFTQGAPHAMKEYGWIYAHVEKEGAYAVNVNQLLLRAGLPSYTSNIKALTTSDTQSEWGRGEWGVALWGGSGASGERFRPQGVRRGSGLICQVESGRWFRLTGLTIASTMGRESLAA